MILLRKHAKAILLSAALGVIAPGTIAAQTVTPSPYQTVFDNSGRIINGACVWTYLAGTTTPATTYTDSALLVPNTNPIKTDSAGRYVAYLANGVSYKLVFENIPCSAISHGSTLKTVDNVSTVPSSNVNLDVTGTVGETIAAGAVAYLSDGSGSKVAGQWYNASANAPYSSSGALYVGVAVSAISSGSSGAIRVSGRVTGLSALVVGSRYYVAATAGTLTATAPTLIRAIGAADSATSLVIAPNPAVTAQPVGLAEGRLTATSGTAVTSSDVSAATSIYYTPHTGNRIALLDSSSLWVVRTFSETTISISSCTASKPYDVFLYDNAGTVAAEILVWTNTTTRATALVRQDGAWVKTGATTRRYVGSFYCNASGGQTDDTFVKRYIWNDANRVHTALRRLETTSSWTYTTATYRQANASTANQLEVMVGLQEDSLSVDVYAGAESSVTNTFLLLGIGLDSTSATATGTILHTGRTAVANVTCLSSAHLETIPAVGLHTFAWLEFSTASGTTTWFGTNNNVQAGISASWAR